MSSGVFIRSNLPTASSVTSEQELIDQGYSRTDAQRALFEQRSVSWLARKRARIMWYCGHAGPGILCLLGIAGLCFALYLLPSLIFVFFTLIPVFCIRLVYWISELGEPAPGPEELHMEMVRFDAEIRDYLNTVRELRSAPRRCWEGRARYGRRALFWLRRGTIPALLFLVSIALVALVAYDNDLIMFYIILQPLLLAAAVKICLDPNWSGDIGSIMSLEADNDELQEPFFEEEPRIIRLQSVPYDPEVFDDVQRPRSCVICLLDFGAPLPESQPLEVTVRNRNTVIIEGDGGDERIVQLPCDTAHCFHAGCIHAWLERHATCPVCRREIDDSTAALVRL